MNVLEAIGFGVFKMILFLIYVFWTMDLFDRKPHKVTDFNLTMWVIITFCYIAYILNNINWEYEPAY